MPSYIETKRLITKIMLFQKQIITLVSFSVLIATMTASKQSSPLTWDKELAVGTQPQIAVDSKGTIHVVYGLKSGNDRQLYYVSSPDGGKSFSVPSLLGDFSQMGLGMGRGPQIAATKDFIIITIGDHHGNLYALRHPSGSGSWSTPVKINDTDSTAKEALSDIAAGIDNQVYTVWLDTRLGNNNLFGAISRDSGATWSKNQLIFKGEQNGICDCCKPSVTIDKNGQLHVMFRNKLNGARNLYLISSKDDGQHFSTAQKLGSGDFMINGCPMDGGDISVNESGNVTTVWRRQTEIFKAEPGKQETRIGLGTTPTVLTTPKGDIVAWHQSGSIYLQRPDGRQIQLGQGQYPRLVSSNGNKIFAVYENGGNIIFTAFEM